MSEQLSDPYSSSLLCGICLEEYKDPRALPCLHTFCHDCLVGIHKRSRAGAGLACPCCREVCQARPSELRRNFHVSRLQEMRPLLAMGIGLAEDFAGRARAQLAGLPDDTELGQIAEQCRQELARLRTEQGSLNAFFDAFEAAVTEEREAARTRFATAKSEVKARRRWARDSLARRSVSERLIACAKSARHQTLLDLLEEFRQLKCNEPPPNEPTMSTGTTGGPGSRPPQLPTQSQVKRRLAAHLGPEGKMRRRKQLPWMQHQQQQQQLQPHGKQRRPSHRQRRQKRERLQRMQIEGGLFDDSDDDDDDTAAGVIVHSGIVLF